MKTLNTIAAAAVALAAAAPAFAGTQVVAGNGLTLTQAAAIKFNADTRQDDHQTVAVVAGKGGNTSQLAAVAGIPADEAAGMSLDQIAVAKFNREARGDDKQAVEGRRRRHVDPLALLRRPASSSSPPPACRPTRRRARA